MLSKLTELRGQSVKAIDFVRCCSFVWQSANCSKTPPQEFCVDRADLHAAHRLILRLIARKEWIGRPENLQKGITDMTLRNRKDEAGKVGYIILWLLGVPFSVLLLIFL